MPVRFRWPRAALPLAIALSLALVVVTPVPAKAVVCDLLHQIGACTPSEQELEFTSDGRIILPGVPSSAAPSAPPAPSSPTLLPDAARHLLDLANQERARTGAPALVFRDDVVQLAIAHTREMVGGGGGIFHNLDLLTKPLRNLLGALAVGENVGWSSHLDDLHPRLMASAPHRAALLDPRFTVAGFAVIHHTDGRYYVTQDFVQPSGATPSPAPAPPAPAPSSGPNAAPAPSDRPGPVPTVTPEAAPAVEVVDPTGTVDAIEQATGAAQMAEGPDGQQVGGSEVAVGEVAVGEVAGIIIEEVSAEAGRAAPLGIALTLLAAVVLGQGWWWARGHRQAGG